MVVAQSIYNASGSILVAEKDILESQYIRRLKEMNIGSLYVVNPFQPGLAIPELLKLESRVKAVQTVQMAYQYYANPRDMDCCDLTGIADAIIQEVRNGGYSLVHYSDVRQYTDYLYAHAVNTAALSCLLAIKMGYTDAKLKDLV